MEMEFERSDRVEGSPKRGSWEGLEGELDCRKEDVKIRDIVTLSEN
jgi:hypothetical protein